MTLDTTGWDDDKLKLHELFLKNELGDKNAYELQHAGSEYGESGLSFGYNQWDLANNSEARLLLRSFLEGETDDEELINDIMNKLLIEGDPNALKNDTLDDGETTYHDFVDQTLHNNEDEIDSKYSENLDDIEERVNHFIDLVKNENPDAGDFLDQDAVKMFLADYHNQFYLDDSEQGKMRKFLEGENVTIGVCNGNPNGYEVQLQGEAGWGDLLDFYFKTKYGQEHPEDLMRRFSNLIEELGVDKFDLTNEDLEYLFNKFPDLLGEDKL